MRRVLASAFVIATLVACSGSTFPEPVEAGADGAAGDGAAGDGSADGGFPGACTEAGAFPGFVKGCGTTANCIIKLHQIDCCGTMMAIGLNHAEFGAFDTAETAWETSCPKCKCPVGPTLAEDGKTGATVDVKVSCDNGTCKTSF
jgi:hypothetical protein